MDEPEHTNPYTVIQHTDNPNVQSTRDPPALPYLLDVKKGDKFVYTGPEIKRGRWWHLLPNTILVVDYITTHHRDRASAHYQKWDEYLMCHGDGEQDHTYRWYSARKLRQMIDAEHLHQVPRDLHRNVTGYHTKKMGHRVGY